MSNLNQIVNVSITRQTVYPSAPGFGTPVFVAYHAFWAALVRVFSTTADLLTAIVAGGGTASHPVYKMAQAALAQNPRITQFVVGKRALASTQIVKLSPLNTTPGFVWSFYVTDVTVGLRKNVTYTNGNSETTTTIGTAIAAAITALALADISSAASVTGVITVTMASGKLVTFDGLHLIGDMTFEDTSTDPGIATDLANIYNASIAGGTSVSFYEVNIDHCCNAIGAAAAAWIESQNLIFVARTSDSKATNGGTTTDLCSVVKSAAYKRTAVIFAQQSNNDYRDCAWAGSQLTFTPGTNTWALKNLAGIVGDSLLDGEASAIEAKNASWYRSLGANLIATTFESKTGFGEFLDIPISADFIGANIQFSVFGALINAPKLTYTDLGIAIIGGLMQTELDKQVEAPGTPRMFAASPAPFVTVPKVATVSTSDKSARRLKNVTFQATLSGAIHGVTIAGNVTV